MIPFALISTFFAVVVIAFAYLVDISSVVIGVAQVSPVISEPNAATPNAPLTAPVPFNIPLVISAIAVFIFYFARFSLWPESADSRLKTRPTRFYTTSYKYLVGATLYGLLMVAFFMLSARFPDYVLATVAKLVGSEAPQLENRNPSELVAYFLAFFLVVWPKLALVDDAIRKALQGNVGIPLQAHQLIKQLLTDNHVVFNLKPETVNHVLVPPQNAQLLRRKDFNLADKVGKEFKPTMARIGYLLAELESKEGKKGYVRALKLQEAEYQDTATAFDELVELANAVDTVSDAKLEKRRLDDASRLLERVYDIVVFSVFLAKHSFEGRPPALLEFGIQVPRAGRLLNPDVLTWIALLLFVGTLFPLGVFMVTTAVSGMTPPADSKLATFIPDGWAEAAIWSVYSTLMHLLAAVVGIAAVRSIIIEQLSKTVTFRPGPVAGTSLDPLSMFEKGTRAPRLFHYFIAFLAAFSLSVYIIALGGLFDPNPLIIRVSWPWAIIPGVTGAFVSYNLMFLLAQEKGKRLDKAMMRSKTLLQASATSVTALFVAFVVVLDKDELLPKPSAFPFLIYAVLAAFIVGGLVAYGVLGWYDKRRAEQVSEESMFFSS